MDANTIARLEQLIAENARLPSHTTPSHVLQDLGVPTLSFAISTSTSPPIAHCISAGSDNTSTLFQACSISKPCTAVLVFKLIQSGHLSLHASISNYLSASDLAALETTATAGMAKFITIAMLLSHTSGLETSGTNGFPGYDVSRNANNHFRAALPDLKEALTGNWPSNTLPIRLKDFPGHRFNYSGGGLGVLQVIVETVMGKEFAVLMQEYVFDALGMTRSTYRVPDDEDLNQSTRKERTGTGNYARAYYNGYTACEAPHRVNPEQAAAGLWTTPTDLAILASAIQISLNSESGFLPRHLAEQMLEEVQVEMGCGWRVACTHFGHGGSNMPGWECNLLADKQSKWAISVMTNSPEGTTVLTKVQAAIFYLLDWEKIEQKFWVIPFADVSVHVPVEEVLKKWEGGWMEQGKEWTVRFVVEEGLPWLQVGEMPKMRLYVAAQAKEEERDGNKIVADLVCKGGLELLVRLMENEKDEPLMELWNGNTRDVTVMELVR